MAISVDIRHIESASTDSSVADYQVVISFMHKPELLPDLRRKAALIKELLCCVLVTGAQ